MGLLCWSGDDESEDGYPIGASPMFGWIYGFRKEIEGMLMEMSIRNAPNSS